MPQLEPVDWLPQLIWLFICFILLYWLMAKVALPRIATVLEERRDRIARDLDAAERLKAETEEAIAAYEQALAEARGKAHNLAQQTRDELAAEVGAERSTVDAELADKAAEAEAAIVSAKASALSHINEVAADTAEAIVGQLIGAKVAKTELKQAVADAVAKD